MPNPCFPALYVAGHPDLIVYWNNLSNGTPNRWLSYNIATYWNPSETPPDQANKPFMDWAYNHFKDFGKYEGRLWKFNAEDYWLRHPDLQAVFPKPAFRDNNEKGENLARHFISYGYNEGRTHDYQPCDSITRVSYYKWFAYWWGLSLSWT